MAGTDDPYGWRQPTSHEVLSGQPWDASYQDGPAPWDTGKPQPAVVRLAQEGAFTGKVLDVGCGTGANALEIADGSGLTVVGLDVAETALGRAREAAASRNLDVEFVVADALQLDSLERTFDSILDCGLFHTFNEAERETYVESLAAITTTGARLSLLCFSDREPGTGGPHRITQHALRRAFTESTGWVINAIEPERFETRFGPDGAAAWLARIART